MGKEVGLMIAKTVAFCILNRFKWELAKGGKPKVEEGLFVYPRKLKMIPRLRTVWLVFISTWPN